MRKKITALLLSLLLVLSAALPVFADEETVPQTRKITILNLKSFEKLAENCRLDSYSRDLVVSLETDLDLTGRGFAGIPIFCGRFEGNGHTIQGLEFTGEGSQQGLFRYLTDTAMVMDLHLEGTVQPAGSASEVGGFVGKNSGLIRNCSFRGTVSGKEFIGGIAGHNTVSGTLEDCRVSGSIYGGHFVGGIAGKNVGVIRSCENTALINETPRQNTVELTDITLKSALQSEAANTVTDVGGIAGISSGFIRDCVNHARVGYPSMGYNIGGIAGTQSGTILSCVNDGLVYGRKEVGGIVGQMEPSSVMEFEEDVIQILTRQLEGMGKIVNQASSNLKGAGEEIVGQIGKMYFYVDEANAAIEELIPTPENPGLPDEDTLQAARNSIGDSLVGMARTVDGMNATAYTALGAVSTNLHEMNSQINVMRNTIGNVSETLGGSVEDLSDQDTELDFAGKVADCQNYGDIHADRNGGGIAGAMALENDLDMEEDWTVTGENSLNFESQIRAVVLNCENTATVSVSKQNAGGVVGYLALGLVKNCRNFGILDAAAADYVGGISGRSTGFIRSSHANGEVSGTEFVGGIAGSASIATDCYSLVHLVDTVEKVGAILGDTEENRTEEENPISGNYYLAVAEDFGGIDGISYDGQAQFMREEGFFLLEGLPERFRQVIVTFRYGNGAKREFAVDVGSSFPMEWAPPIPPKEGRQSYWKGLEDAELNGIFFDMTFQQEYTTQTTVLESALTREEIPLLFVQGVFAADAELEAAASDVRPDWSGSGQHLETWEFRCTEPENQTQIRLQIPSFADPERISVLLRDKSGNWRVETSHVLGRYAVARLMPGDDAIALVQEGAVPWMLIGLAAVFAAGAGLYIRKKKTKA